MVERRGRVRNTVFGQQLATSALPPISTEPQTPHHIGEGPPADIPVVRRPLRRSLRGPRYSLERLFRWLSVSRSLMSAVDNLGRSILMLSFTILPVKANGTW